ncbi:MAG: phosphomannose isomerase type II C-terminal cupin domain [Candidatus Omnitrophota bacterium]|nr:MAG: phosphomannose isomerase type II C-terminal cupin domain [Candidatus Omnitrophota bacterium]
MLFKKRKQSSKHKTAERPWGSYTVLEEGRGYKIKRVFLKPHKRLSLQSHSNRSEHWVVVRGRAKATIGGEVFFATVDRSIYVPRGAAHRLENPQDIDLEIIEVQSGDYLGEDDIKRIEDDFGRT